MAAFPVYDELVAMASMSNSVDWTKACVQINALPVEHTNFITALIFHHYQLELQSKSAPSLNQSHQLERLLEQYRNDSMHKTALMLPYGGQTFKTGKGVVVTVGNLPPTLQKVIGNYLEKITI